MYKFTLGRHHVTQSSSYISPNQAKEAKKRKATKSKEKKTTVIESSKKTSITAIKKLPDKKSIPIRRNKLNFSKATCSKIIKSLDALFIFSKSRYEQENVKLGKSKHGYFYEFKLPAECLHSTHSLNRDLFSKFLENLCTNYELKLYTWCVKHNSKGNPYYLLYTPDQMKMADPKSIWLKALMKYFFYDETIKFESFFINHYARFLAIDTRNQYENEVKYHFLKKNKIPFSGCKRFITRECRIYRSFGRTQKLADILPLNVILDNNDAEIFIRQLKNNATNIFEKPYYRVFYLPVENIWYKEKYLVRLEKMIIKGLEPLYELQKTG